MKNKIYIFLEKVLQARILKISTILLAGVLVFLLLYPGNSQFDFDHLSQSTVKITSFFNGKPKWSGTGFIISSDGYVVTCNHVVEESRFEIKEDKEETSLVWGRRKKKDFILPEPERTPEKQKKERLVLSHHASDKIEVEFFGIPGVKLRSVVVWKNRVFDLAILKFNSPVKLPYLKLSNNEPKIGQRLYAVGHPMMLAWAGYETTLVGVFFRNDEVYHYAVRDAISPGISGAPVVNKNYKVVCIVDSVIVNTITNTGVDVCVPVQAVLWATKTLNLKL